MSNPFKDEQELEHLLATHPGLLQGTDADIIFLVGRQVPLPEAGTIDLFLTTVEALPVIVEVKLGTNSELRRKIVAQIIDYVSDLTLLDFYKLDGLLEGGLVKTLDALDAELEPEEVRRLFASHLTSGETRFILAVDSAPTDLIRIVEFLWRHTNLDIRLIQIRKFKDENGLITFDSVVKVGGEVEAGRGIVSAGPLSGAPVEHVDFYRAIINEVPGFIPRKDTDGRGAYRYATYGLPKACQVRYDILTREALLRLSFKSWQSDPGIVEQTIDKMFPKWKDAIPGHDGYRLESQRGRGKTISYFVNIPLSNEHGLGSTEVRKRSVAILTWLIEHFGGPAQQL